MRAEGTAAASDQASIPEPLGAPAAPLAARAAPPVTSRPAARCHAR
ncbi:MAG TPA: hypothetical protein VGV61_04015 [Thermoanaerobaculia bacterium]|nr:hypothetical protein [Thermoanaerobaculia bacterium]